MNRIIKMKCMKKLKTRSVFARWQRCGVGCLAVLALVCPGSLWAWQVALLVSLGMPDAVLRAYMQQSQDWQIPLVIRGFYPASGEVSATGTLRATAARLQQLGKTQDATGVLIDPRLFRAFAIHAVPALVIYDPRSPCWQPHHYRLSIPSRTQDAALHDSPPVMSCDAQAGVVVTGNLSLDALLARVGQETHDPAVTRYVTTLRAHHASTREPSQ